MFVLLVNAGVDSYIEKARNKIIQIYGDPDAGRTTVFFQLIGNLTSKDHICVYVTPQLSSFRYEYFKKFSHDYNRCVIMEASTAADLLKMIPTIADYAEYIFIDDFLRYIIRRKKSEIRSVMSMLSSQAFKHGICIVIGNEMRYNLSQSLTLPAYTDILRRYVSNSIVVEKNKDQLDIVYDAAEA